MEHRLLLDIDGVVCDYISWFEECVAKAGCEVVTPRGRDWNLMRRYAIPKDKYYDVHQATHTERIDAAAPIPGALDGIDDLLAMGWDIYFVTASLVPNKTWEYDRRKWSWSHIGAWAADRLVFTKQKHLISGDVLVDDGVHNIDAWTRYWPNGLGYLFGDVGLAGHSDWWRLVAQLDDLMNLRRAAEDWHTKGTGGNPILGSDLKEQGGWL